jgi:hypothetical protein
MIRKRLAACGKYEHAELSQSYWRQIKCPSAPWNLYSRLKKTTTLAVRLELPTQRPSCFFITHGEVVSAMQKYIKIKTAEVKLRVEKADEKGGSG